MNGKAVAYLRRSTDRQDQSIDDQRKAVERYAQERGIEVVKYYVDDAVSGTSTDDRKGFQQMLSDARTDGRDWRLILVYDVKRFGRVDNDEAGHYRFLLRQAGIDVVYVAENFSGDDTDDLLRPVKQWQARQESKDLSRVTIRGLLSLSEGGWWMGGAPPYGYDLLYHDASGRAYMLVRFMENGSKQIFDPKGKPLRVIERRQALATASGDRSKLVKSAPERVDIVRRIFAMYLNGDGYKTIASSLNAQGIPSPRNAEWGRIHDGKWSTESVRSIIVNRLYTGDMVWNRRAEGRFHRISGRRAVARESMIAGQARENPETDWIVVEDAHEAIVERAQYFEAQKLRMSRERIGANNGFTRGMGKISPYLLTGLLKCSRCGRNLQGHVVAKSERRKDGSRVRTRYYLCGGYVSKGPSVCEKALFPQEALDEFVLDVVESEMERLLSENGRETLRRVIDEELRRSGDDPREEIGRLKGRLAEIDAQADRLLDLLDGSNKQFVDQKLGKLKKEKELVKARLEELTEKKTDILDLNSVVEGILAFVSQAKQSAREGTPEERKSFLRSFVTKFDMDPDKGEGLLHVRDVPDPAAGILSNSSIAGVGFEPTTSGL